VAPGEEKTDGSRRALVDSHVAQLTSASSLGTSFSNWAEHWLQMYS